MSFDASPSGRAPEDAPVPPGGGHGAEPVLVLEDEEEGRWVSTPDGRRIFVVGPPRGARPESGAPPPPASPDPAAADPEAPEPAALPAPRSAWMNTPPEPAPARRFASAEEIELHGEELQEIVGSPPHWLVRWGITAIFTVLAAAVAMSFVVHYPELVRGRVRVTTATPPVRLASRAGGEVARVLARDGQPVRRGDYLVVFRNPADEASVRALSQALDGADAAIRRGEVPADPTLLPTAALGDAQRPYADYRQALSEYRSFLALGYYPQKLASLQAQAADYERQRQNLEARQRLLGQELELAQRQHVRDRELVQRELLSPSEAERNEAAYLQKQQEVEASRSEQTGNEIRLSEARGTLLDLQQKEREERLRLQLAVRASYEALREAVRRWEDDHVLRAPGDGRVSFFRALSVGQYVAPSEPVMAIVPPGGLATATVQVPPAGAGRIRPGQKVILKFESYPVQEFGTVEGRVTGMSLVADRPEPEGDSAPRYLVSVSLPRGLRTSYGKILPLQQEMPGTADIVTQDARVVDRIFDRFRSLAQGTGR